MKKVVAILLLVAAHAFPLDGHRGKGGLFQLGVGPGFTTYTLELKYPNKTADWPREAHVGFANSILVGGGMTETLFITLFMQMNWLPYTNSFDSHFVANSITGIGLLKYFKADVDTVFKPSSYVFTGIGATGWNNPFDNSQSVGFGLSLGMGYEFVKHFGVQFGGFYSNISPAYIPSYLDDIKINSFGFQLSLVGIAY